MIIKIINNKNYHNGVFIVCMFYLFTTFERTTNRLQFTRSYIMVHIHIIFTRHTKFIRKHDGILKYLTITLSMITKYSRYCTYTK